MNIRPIMMPKIQHTLEIKPGSHIFMLLSISWSSKMQDLMVLINEYMYEKVKG